MRKAKSENRCDGQNQGVRGAILSPSNRLAGPLPPGPFSGRRFPDLPSLFLRKHGQDAHATPKPFLEKSKVLKRVRRTKSGGGGNESVPVESSRRTLASWAFQRWEVPGPSASFPPKAWAGCPCYPETVSPSASCKALMSSVRCAAERVTRRRAEPRGTVG